MDKKWGKDVIIDLVYLGATKNKQADMLGNIFCGYFKIILPVK